MGRTADISLKGLLISTFVGTFGRHSLDDHIFRWMAQPTTRLGHKGGDGVVSFLLEKHMKEFTHLYTHCRYTILVSRRKSSSKPVFLGLLSVISDGSVP